MSVILLSVMGAVAEFEQAIIRERQAEGIRIAKLKGVYKGRHRLRMIRLKRFARRWLRESQRQGLLGNTNVHERRFINI